MKKIVFFITLLLSINVMAATCEKEELARLKNLAQQVEFKTDYELKENQGIKYAEFSVTAYNLNEDLKIVIDSKNKNNTEFKYNDTKKYTLKPFVEGAKIKVIIYGYTTNGCSGKEITTKTLTMPYYNKYYSEDTCKDTPDFKYCSEIVNKDLSLNEFYDELNKHVNANSKEIEEKDANKEKGISLYIIIIVTISVIVLVGVVAMVIMNKRKKNAL